MLRSAPPKKNPTKNWTKLKAGSKISMEVLKGEEFGVKGKTWQDWSAPYRQNFMKGPFNPKTKMFRLHLWNFDVFVVDFWSCNPFHPKNKSLKNWPFRCQETEPNKKIQRFPQVAVFGKFLTKMDSVQQIHHQKIPQKRLQKKIWKMPWKLHSHRWLKIMVTQTSFCKQTCPKPSTEDSCLASSQKTEDVVPNSTWILVEIPSFANCRKTTVQFTKVLEIC